MIGIMFWNINRIYFSFLVCKTLRAIVTSFLLSFFQSSFFWWKIYSFPYIFIYKRFNFCYSFGMLSYFFMICSGSYIILKVFYIIFIDKIYCCCLSSQENLYMIHHNSDLFYDIYYTINEHNQRQTYYLSSIPNYFDICFCMNQKVFYHFICFIINHDSYAITFWMHFMLFIIIFGKNKVICYC